MKLATITNWAYGATVALTLASGSAMLFASSVHQRERAAVEQRYELDQATAGLRNELYRLTGQARQFVVDGDPGHLVVYRREVAALKSVENRIKHIEDAGASRDELDTLADSMRWADTLQDEQRTAIAAYRQGDEASARRIMFGAEYERELGRVEAAIERFQYRLDQRTADAVEDATQSSLVWRRISEAVLAITGLLFLCVLYFILRRRILNPVIRLSDVVMRLAAQDYAVEPPELDQVDEIGDMALALRVFQENGLERQRLEKQRGEDMHIRELMSRMTQRMQSCETMDELGDVVAHFVPAIASDSAGRLYLYDKQRNALGELCHWQSPRAAQDDFSPMACWGLRRGAKHRFAPGMGDMPCEHLGELPGDEIDTICMPLTAQNENLGLLYIERPRSEDAGEEKTPDVYLEMLAENIGLAVANLRLRGELSEMAMVDSLTGLANRRKFELCMKAYRDRGEGPGPVSCLVLDIDHFKQFNDRFGHDAGDEVLRQVGAALKNAVRDSAMAFRYGGEEFVVLISDIDPAKVSERAEDIRRVVAALDLRHESQPLGAVSVSVGVASAPSQTSIERLVQTADAALLRAKQEGRDRVVVAQLRQDEDRSAA